MHTLKIKRAVVGSVTLLGILLTACRPHVGLYDIAPCSQSYSDGIPLPKGCSISTCKSGDGIVFDATFTCKPGRSEDDILAEVEKLNTSSPEVKKELAEGTSQFGASYDSNKKLYHISQQDLG